MKHNTKRRVFLGVVGMLTVSLLGSGCTTLSDNQRTTAEGAGMGAVLGAAVGGIIGHQSGSGAEGAIIGGLLGAAMGGLYGNHVAGKKAEFASEEEYLDAVLAEARRVRDEAEQHNRTLETEIAQLDQQVAETLAAMAAGTANQETTQALRTDLVSRLSEAESGLEAVSDEIRIQREVAATEAGQGDQEQLRELEATIAELEAQKDELTAQTERLADLNNRMSV